MAATTRRTVLVVEDDREVNDLLFQLFSLAGYRVLRAFDGGEVCELIEMHRPDVVILDLMLPAKLGQDILRQVKAKPSTGATPVIVVSGYVDQLSADDRHLASAVMGKPFDCDRLLAEADRLSTPRL